MESALEVRGTLPQNRTKPHLYLLSKDWGYCLRMWACIGAKAYGYGETKEVAYRHWKQNLEAV